LLLVVQKAIETEREACAKLCAEFGIQGWDCEEAIRARGQA